MSYSLSFVLKSVAILVTVLSVISTTSASSKCNTTHPLIAKECNSTHFPTLCCISLTPFTPTIKTTQDLCGAAINVSLTTHVNVLNMLTDMSNDEGVKANTTEDTYFGIVNCMLDFGDAGVPMERVNLTFNATNVEYVVNEVKYLMDVAIEKYKLCFRELNESGLSGPLKMKIVNVVTRVLKLARITLSLFKSL